MTQQEMQEKLDTLKSLNNADKESLKNISEAKKNLEKVIQDRQNTIDDLIKEISFIGAVKEFFPRPE